MHRFPFRSQKISHPTPLGAFGASTLPLCSDNLSLFYPLGCMLQLYPLMPASVATAERSFSALIHSESDKKETIVVSFRGLRPGPD